MAIVVPFEDIRSSPTASLFEGDKHGGGTPVSSFIVATHPGRGPSLHTHPYAEVFIVLEGQARFTAGDEEVSVDGGNVVVVPPETPHKFVNSGDGTLRMVNVHANGSVVQTDLE